KASFEAFEYVFSARLPRHFPRPFGFEFLEQRGFDHGFAPSQELEQLRVMIPQTGQKLGHGQQIFVLMGRVLIDAGATLAHDQDVGVQPRFLGAKSGWRFSLPKSGWPFSLFSLLGAKSGWPFSLFSLSMRVRPAGMCRPVLGRTCPFTRVIRSRKPIGHAARFFFERDVRGAGYN